MKIDISKSKRKTEKLKGLPERMKNKEGKNVMHEDLHGKIQTNVDKSKRDKEKLKRLHGKMKIDINKSNRETEKLRGLHGKTKIDVSKSNRETERQGEESEVSSSNYCLRTDNLQSKHLHKVSLILELNYWNIFPPMILILIFLMATHCWLLVDLCIMI